MKTVNSVTQQADFPKVFSSLKISDVCAIQAYGEFVIANDRNQRTTMIFQILSIAHARSEFREQQIVTCDLVQFFGVVLEKKTKKMATNLFYFSVFFGGGGRVV
jgi:hypothetical protein